MCSCWLKFCLHDCMLWSIGNCVYIHVSFNSMLLFCVASTLNVAMGWWLFWTLKNSYSEDTFAKLWGKMGEKRGWDKMFTYRWYVTITWLMCYFSYWWFYWVIWCVTCVTSQRTHLVVILAKFFQRGRLLFHLDWLH